MPVLHSPRRSGGLLRAAVAAVAAAVLSCTDAAYGPREAPPSAEDDGAHPA
ncbi:hypothetical protein [Streptomyces sp. NPDC059957]|uniref:hypothetical protein n=1 Tax=Streptomyces sp. NPDC059957 TaxID=3347016 RepID=UPI00365BDA6E